jgi:tryptophan synthase alpha chain
VCIGFGVSGPAIAETLAPHADGLIVGSAIVRRVAESATPELAEKSIESFVGQLRQAIDRATLSAMKR